LCKNPNSLTNHEKKQIFKFVQFLPPLETLSSSLHTDSSLELIHKLSPEEALRIVKGIPPLREAPTNSQIAVLNFIERISAEKFDSVVKNIQKNSTFKERFSDKWHTF
jgi:hypothetical protein